MNRRPILWAALVGAVVMAAMSLWASPELPERVPMHWDWQGRPNRLGSRTEALVAIPLVTLGTGGLLWLLPLFFPRREHLALSARAYNAVAIAGVGFLTMMHAAILLGGMGRTLAIDRLVPLAAGGLMIVMGNYLPKTRRNWLFGIRTPWTLTSDRAWMRTHRLGGRLFVFLGVVILGAAVIVPGAAEITIVGGAAAVVVVLLVYSYREWRLDPAREG